MSSTTEVTLSVLFAELQSIKAKIDALQSVKSAVSSSSSVVSAGKKQKKEKKAKDPNAPKRERTSWGSFTDRVRALLKANAYEGKDVATLCVQFCSDLKKENDNFDSWTDADILARRTDWSAPEVSKQKAEGKSKRKDGTDSAAASVVSAAEKEKPKKERKTKAKKSESAAAAATATAASSAKVESESVAVATSSVSNAASHMTSSSVAAPVAKPVATTSAPELKPVILSSVRYLVDMETSHAWVRVVDSDNKPTVGEDGKPVKGAWAGLFHFPTKDAEGKAIAAYIESIPDPNVKDEEY